MFTTRIAAKRSTIAACIALCAACGANDDMNIEDALAQTATAPSASATSPAQTRDGLKAIANNFLTALQTKATGELVAADAIVTENAVKIPLSNSLLLGAKSYPYQVFFAEPAANTAGLFAVADVGPSLVVFSARLKVLGGLTPIYV